MYPIGYDQLLVNAMAADAHSAAAAAGRQQQPLQMRGPEMDEEELEQMHSSMPYQGPAVSQLTREEREWEREKKQMAAMKRLRPPPEARQ